MRKHDHFAASNTVEVPRELETATRMAVEPRRDVAAKSGAYRRTGEQPSANPDALRGWVHRAETDQELRPGTTTGGAALPAELDRGCASYAGWSATAR